MLSLTVAPGSQDVILKAMWFSLDPGFRLCMQESLDPGYREYAQKSDDGRFLSLFELNKPVQGWGIFKVLVSDDESFRHGDIVKALTNVAQYPIVHKGGLIFKIKEMAIPLSYHLGVLGMSGLTAWVGVNVIGKAKAGDEVYITGAAGSVGLVAGQLAKAKGCRVVGSAGSDEKVRVLKECGFDDAFNYKVESEWDIVLTRCFPNGIDLYFDNVGGTMLEAVLDHINFNGRIVVSGMISQYNQERSSSIGIRNLMNIVGKNVKIEGFMGSCHMDQEKIFFKEVFEYIQASKIKSKEYVTKGIENFPKAYISLFKGENIGKCLLNVEI